jgi:hypothetical protein
MKEFNDNLELGSDMQDEYQAIQEAEAANEPEMASDEEIRKLLIEMWNEVRSQGDAERLDPQGDDSYTEEDAFRDYISDQYNEFN